MNTLELNLNLINQKEWNKVLDDIKDKKIVIFGAGNNGEILVDLIPYKVAYFIDNSKTKLDEELRGIIIKNPEVLKTEKENIAVIVGGYRYDDMIHQLESFNLGKNIEIYNVYKIMERAINKISFSKRGEDFINLLKEIPPIRAGENNLLSQEKISIIINNFLFSGVVFHLITIAIMLKFKGNHVHLIWDDSEGYDDLFYDWDNATITQNKTISKVLSYVHDKFNIEITKISDMKDAVLDTSDYIRLKKLAQVNTIWKYRVSSVKGYFQDYQKECFEVLKRNLKKIKCLFNNIRTQRIITFSGLHGKTGLYTWVAQNKNIQIYSYDSGMLGLKISTNGECSYQMDIKRIIEEKYLSKVLRDKLISFAKEEFNKRLNMINNIENRAYQIVQYSNSTINTKFDVIIPLNVSWDSSALGKHRYFDSTEDWVLDTVEYILQNTSASVAVRQHPVEVKFKSGKDLQTKLQEKFGGNCRFTYISSLDNINTYNLIEESKVVLPYTSTVGIEAALLNKPVILESDVYYSEMAFVQKAKSREDYFEKISDCLNDCDCQKNYKTMEEALLCYGILMFNIIKTDFTHTANQTWIKKTFKDLIEDKSVEKIITTFATGKPLALMQIEEYFQ